VIAGRAARVTVERAIARFHRRDESLRDRFAGSFGRSPGVEQQDVFEECRTSA
jgi:hypothetical protein